VHPLHSVDCGCEADALGGAMMAVFMPMTRPAQSQSGTGITGLSAASVWMTLSITSVLLCRLRPRRSQRRPSPSTRSRRDADASPDRPQGFRPAKRQRGSSSEHEAARVRVGILPMIALHRVSVVSHRIWLARRTT